MYKNKIELAISQELFERAETDVEFLKNIITGDKS